MIANYRQAVQVAEPEPEVNYVEFIRSTGTQYIDTGFKPNNNTRAVIVFEPDESIKNGWYFGARTSTSSSDRFCLLSDDSGKKIRSDFGSNNTNTNVSPSGKMTVDKNKNVTTINGNQVFTSSNATFSTNYNLYLFAGNSGGEVFSPIPIYLYSFELYDNDVLVRDYAPVLDPEGVACLYDKVSEEYVYNSGSGSFTAGPVKEPESPEEVDEHTLLLLHGEAFEDSSMYRRTVGDFGATISTAQKKFGSSSFYFNGNSKLLISSSIDFKSNDFTVDWWEYCTASSNGTRFSSPWTSTSDLDGGFLIGYHGTSVFAKTGPSAGSWNLVSNAPLVSVTTSQWVHWAIVRNGNTLISFRNGVRYSSVSINSGNIHYDPSNPMAVGGYRQFNTDYFSGYIDEFRISDVARWTTNFTPPTAPYES